VVRSTARRRLLVVLVALAAALAPPLAAQILPLRCYGVREGLGHSRVTSILQSRRGYLWFGTWEGASRFDGYGFVNFGPRSGLPDPIVEGLAEDGDGNLYFATARGLARLAVGPLSLGPPFDLGGERAPAEELSRVGLGAAPGTDPGAGRGAEHVHACARGPGGALWCATDAGLYRAVPEPAGAMAFTRVLARRGGPPWRALRAAPDGELWLGAGGEVVAVGAGATRRWPLPGGRQVVALEPAADGSLLVATRTALLHLDPTAGSWRRRRLELGEGERLQALLRGPEGKALWIGTNRGLLRLEGDRQEVYTAAQGLPGGDVLALGEDRDGNLWIGTASAGACQLLRDQLATRSWEEGLPDPDLAALAVGREGRLYALGARGGWVEVAGDHLLPVVGSGEPAFSRPAGRPAQDLAGGWWVGTATGLWRLPGPALALAGARRPAAGEGIPPGAAVAAVAAAPDGGLWVALADGTLLARPPGAAAFSPLEPVGLPPRSGLAALAGDGAGGLWLAARSGLYRRRRGGDWEALAPGPGLPGVEVLSLHLDHRGTLWLGLRGGGVSWTADPEAERPAFHNLSTADGLTSDAVSCLAEDRFGRLYFGTGRGLDVYEPAGGRLRHLTVRDGLAGDFVHDLAADRRGRIWVATATGLSRLDPGPPRPAAAAPPVFLVGLQAAGVELPLPPGGVQEISGLTLPAAEANLAVDYLGLSFAAANPPLYQHRFAGVDRDWSRPTPRRSVSFPHLAPGSYRFAVRAVNEDGVASAEAATLSFRVLPPLWRRGWFLALAAAALAAAAFWLHRFRRERAVALERLRLEIATDLHDDLGSGLAQIAILGEVARRDQGPRAAATLGEIAALARSLRESMADIVWAIDPRRDRLSNLVGRMRQVAYNLLEAEGVEVQFTAPGEREIDRIGLDPDRRRHLLLAFKEALANVARHAAASRARIEIAAAAGRLRLTVEDDGRGFDPQTAVEGEGLMSLRRRAAALGGSLEVRSAPGAGTTVELTVPLGRPHPTMRSPGRGGRG
jgi:signal transduction histidine kinase/ligand-binding sensor domain-containing protein